MKDERKLPTVPEKKNVADGRRANTFSDFTMEYVVPQIEEASELEFEENGVLGDESSMDIDYEYIVENPGPRKGRPLPKKPTY